VPAALIDCIITMCDIRIQIKWAVCE